MNDMNCTRFVSDYNLLYYDAKPHTETIIMPITVVYKDFHVTLYYKSKDLRDKDLDRLDKMFLAKRILDDGTMEYYP